MSRIISYEEKTGYNDGDYLLLDNGEGGTKRIRADRVGIQLDPTLTDPNKSAPANAVKPVDAIPTQGSNNAVSSGGVYEAIQNAETFTNAIKDALLACFQNVAWTTEDGQQLYQALYDTLYPDGRIISISAVFTQGTAKIYTTNSLDVLKQYLTVTVTYYGGTESVVTDYVLRGVLEEGTSTITVIYGGKTATFNVIVSPVISKRYITSEDVESHVGISDISVSNGTINETTPQTFSIVVFNTIIDKMWFHLHTHLDSRRRPRYVFRKEQDGSFYGIDENATSPKLYHFTLDKSGNKYSVTQVSDVSSITTITKSGDYFSSLEKEMSLSNGVLSVVDENSSISFTNANCFGYWQATYNTNINAGMFDDCEVEYNGSV